MKFARVVVAHNGWPDAVKILGGDYVSNTNRCRENRALGISRLFSHSHTRADDNLVILAPFSSSAFCFVVFFSCFGAHRFVSHCLVEECSDECPEFCQLNCKLLLLLTIMAEHLGKDAKTYAEEYSSFCRELRSFHDIRG